jgi:CheY-like chemotaxis protein
VTPTRANARRILVVEDDDDVRASIAEMLTDAGYDVVTATDGSRALEVLRADPAFALIVLDLFMPVMNGWRFREEQKREPAIAGIPVLALSARRAQAPIDADAVLSKPMKLTDLLEAVGRSARPSPESG